MDASLPHRGRGACATDNQGLETAEVKISRWWAPWGTKALKIVTEIADASGASNPKTPTKMMGSCSGGRPGGRSGAEDGQVAPKLIRGILEVGATEIPEAPTLL